MAALFDTTRNLSFYTIPVAWLLATAPHVYTMRLYESATKKEFPVTAPRTLLAKLDTDQSLDNATKSKLVRSEAAQQNGFENLGLFAAAVVAANVANVDNWWLNVLSMGYLASRAVYNVVYINNETKGAATMRSSVFMGGIAMIFTLFIKAGNQVRNGPANLI